MKSVNFTILALLILFFSTNAQENTTEEFIPSGSPSVMIFSNAHSTFIDGENSSAFEIQRAYFGYKYSFSKSFSTKITLDIGDPGTGKLQMTAFLKNAYLEYKTGNLKVNFGVIGLMAFKVQEKHWGYRYIYKSFQDEHKFNSSADLGTSIAYKFGDYFSADFTLMNGEGYKQLQSDDTYKAGLGLTLTPIKKLNFRVYYDYMSTDIAQSTLALFGGYKADKFKIGAEYNIQMNNRLVEDYDLTGISLYTTVIATKKFNFFARYDNLESAILDGQDDPWNISKDGQAYILGIEYKPVKGVKISPNFQGWSPKEEDAPFGTSIYLNFEYSFN
jgi:hypothetical protein